MTPRGRLATRVYLFALAITAVVAASIIFLPRYLFGSRIEQHQIRTVTIMADDIGRRPVADIPATVARIAPHLAGPVSVYDTAGHLIATSVDPPLPAPTADEATELAARGATVDDRRHLARTATGIDVVYDPPPPRYLTHRVAILWALSLTLILVGSLLFARSLARPLGRLGDAARRLGAGDTKARAHLHRRDELGQVGRAFDDMADRIEHLLRAQRDLVADVSHELRTPLSRLRVALEIAADDPAGAADTLRDIQTDLDELARLVDDILTAGRLDAGAPGALALQRRPVRLGDLAQTSADRFANLHADHRLRLQLDDPDATVACDPVLLRRAVDNLLDNAAKYSDKATEVELTMRKADGAVEMVIADHGVGMTEDEIEHAFTPFWRADRSRTRGTGGVGLGLTLSQRIARAHDGDVTLAPGRTGGTTATVRIPA